MSKKIPSYAKAFKNHKVIVFDENNSITHYDVFNIEDGTIETPVHFLMVKDALKVYDNNNGGFTYIFNLPELAQVQAAELKQLRRNKLLNNIMSYETEKSLDLGKLFPYVVAIAAILFK